MKKKTPIFVGAIAASIASVVIYFRRFLGPVALLKDALQLFTPFFLALVFAVKPGIKKEKLWNIGLALGSFFIILSALSPFAFQYWVTYVTPAGNTYTRYGLDALYPFLGIFIVLIAFIVGLVVVLTQDVFRRVVKVHHQGQEKT